MRRLALILPAVLASLTPLVRARADDGLTLLPADCTLSTPESRQRLIVQHREQGEIGPQVVEKVEWSSSDPQVATVADGVVTPVRDGEASVAAKVGDRTVTAKVVVNGLGRPFVWSFRNHVEPVLAKLGCNSGACHGALAGKGGFRLSLRGYDPAADQFTIVKQDRGRRVELPDPGRSLVLAKPSGAIAHKGGVRFAPGSLEYRVLAEWIGAGAPPPDEDDPRVTGLEVDPERSTHRVGQTQQVLVRARYSDGRAEDVTRWVIWSSTDES
ncbi:MAG TPA: Ig-like domain-containing protein, partial [Isosphaeraceae bacterium]|nr:Ig-like domain-containing protein [Isosphaeraceae bacterium]